MILSNRILTSSALLVSTLLIGCGGGGGSSSKKVVDPIPVTQSNQCVGQDLAASHSCIAVDGRETLAYIPNDINAETSLAVFLHGAPGSTRKVMDIFDAKSLADNFNLIALAPDGNSSDYEWDSQNISADNVNLDIDYLTAIIGKVRAEQSVPAEKVYVFGYSAGGFMAYKLACKVPEMLTAIISLAGQYRGDIEACPTSTPVNVHHFHSPFDKDVPYGGRDFGKIASVADTMAIWTTKNGCSGDVSSVEGPGVTATSAKTTTESYRDCSHSLALSVMETVDHEDDYMADRLTEYYAYLFE